MDFDKSKFKEECERRRSEGLIVKGNTYPIKDQIKELGGIWDSRQKQWLMPDQAAVSACAAALNGESPADQPEAESSEPEKGQSSTEMPEMPF